MRNKMIRLGLALCLLVSLLTIGAQAATTQTMRVLLIGNSFSRDSTFYLGRLAKLTGYEIEVAHLQKSSATLRHHARNAAKDLGQYSYYKTDGNGDLKWEKSYCTIEYALADGDWDVVSLQQGSMQAGMPSTYNADLEYLVDYIRGVEPGADLFWNLTWAYDEDTSTYEYPSGTQASGLKTYYEADQETMYNAIVDCFEKYVFNSGEFDGWFPTGVAVQNLRGTYGTSVTRDGFHLSLAAGRMTAAMTLLKTLCPNADLSLITAESVAEFIDLDQTDDGIDDTDATTYENTEANMDLIRAAVSAATTPAALSKVPDRLSGAVTQDKVESKGDGDFTIAQADAPMKLHFPDITVLKDGTALVSAYEHENHYSATNVTNDDGTSNESYCAQGGGRLYVYASTDNGANWDTENPLLFIDETWLEEKGLVTLSNRYERLKNNANLDYEICGDPRDPNFGLVYTDITGDGRQDEVVLFTFWSKYYKEGGSYNRQYMMWSIDKGQTWSEPQQIGSGIKRGDIAAFSNGEILVPLYNAGYSKQAVCLQMHWDSAQKKWVEDAYIPLPKVDLYEHETDGFNEASFLIPDPDEDVVYAFLRENGVVLKSSDRGDNWEKAGNEPGVLEQPGFAYINKDYAFATWTRRPYSRVTYGKMVNWNEPWDGQLPQVVYEPPAGETDTGDPSSKVMHNGKILVVSYDGNYRSIVGTWVDLKAAGTEELFYDDMNSHASGKEPWTADSDRYSKTSTLDSTYYVTGTGKGNSSAVFAADPTNSANQCLKVTVDMDGSTTRRQIVPLNTSINGSYVLEFDYLSETSGSNVGSGYMDVYLQGSGRQTVARLAYGKTSNNYFMYNTKTMPNHTEEDVQRSPLVYTLKDNTWYSVRIMVSGEFSSMEIWEKDDEDNSNQTRQSVVTYPATKVNEKYSWAPSTSGNKVEFCFGPYGSSNVQTANGTYVNYLDNIRITGQSEETQFYVVKAVDGEYGTVSTDCVAAAEGDTVTVTAIPDVGCELEGILVDGNLIQGNTFVAEGWQHTVTAQFKGGCRPIVPSGYFIDMESSLGLKVYLGTDKDMTGYTYTVNCGDKAEQTGNVVSSVDGGYYMTFEDIAAKEMRDAITFTIYNGTTPVYVLETSVYEAAVWMGNENGDDTAYQTMLADMIAYGTAAQVNWGHNTDLLTSKPDLEGGSKNAGVWLATPNVGASEALKGKVAATLSLKDRIELNIYVGDVGAQLTSVTFNGSQLSDLSQYRVQDDRNPNLACFKFGDLAVKDVKGVFELEITLSDGETTGTVRYSIADYVLGALTDPAQQELIVALQKYVDSVIDYFVPQMDNITTDVDELRIYRIIGS